MESASKAMQTLPLLHKRIVPTLEQKENIEMVTKPTIHLNGTHRADLHDGYRSAYDAVQEAITVMNRTHPHGRDYYVQGSGVIVNATAEHFARLRKLESVMKELEELALATMPE